MILVLVDWGYRRAGDSLFPGGALDETAHLVTALFVLWALGRGVPTASFRAALAASVLIDVDHIPDRFGIHWLTAGTPRPYSHSFLTLALVLAVALLGPRHRAASLGAFLGLVIHFWRDLGESGAGVPLLWPFSYASWTVPHWVYLLSLSIPLIAIGVRLARKKSLDPLSSHIGAAEA